MIDPDATSQDPAAVSAPAAASPPATGQETVTTQPPATAAPRRRRRWGLAALAAVVVLGLAAGLVVWAPWIPPPVLRPTGLRTGPATATSVTLRWSRPPTGPLPDKYLIWSSGTMTGSAAGTATSDRQTGLTPASTYHYRVVAVRGDKRSPASAGLTLSTLTRPSPRPACKTTGTSPPETPTSRTSPSSMAGSCSGCSGHSARHAPPAPAM